MALLLNDELYNSINKYKKGHTIRIYKLLI